MRINSKRTSLVVLFTYWVSLVANPAVVWAVSSQGGYKDANAARFSVTCGGTGVKKDCTACNTFCKQFGSDPTSPLGLTSSSWGSADDALCSDMGVYTTGVRPSVAPTPVPSYTSCNYTITPGILTATGVTDPAEACVKAGQFADHCTYHNSQVETQCLAEQAIGDQGAAYAADAILMTLDLGVVLACGLACSQIFNPAGNVNAQIVCSGLSAAEGVAELGASIGMMTGKTQEYISAIGGGLGSLVGTIGVKVAAQAMAKELAEKAAAKAAADLGTDVGKKAAAEAEHKAAQNAGNKASCATAVIFTALFAIRVANLAQLAKTQADACSSVDSLLGTFGGATAGSGGSTGATTTTGGATATGTATAGATGSNFGQSLGTGTGAVTVSKLEAYDNCRATGAAPSACLANVGLSATGSATDSNLIPPGAHDHLLNNIPNVADLAKKAISEGAGAALAGALSAETGSDVGNALVGLANVAQSDSQLGAQMNMGSTYSGGGGGGGGGNSMKSESPFGSLFGGGGAGGAQGAQGPALASFGAAPQGPDIWHAHTHMNLFEIVSDKLGKVSSRVK